jgi:hypothetical protein
MKAAPWSEGLVFSPNGRQAIGEGSWIKRQWRKAQLAAKVRHPIRWHDLRHQYVSLLIAAGKSPKYIAEQAGHSSVGFTLDLYGHLFETIKPVPVEWPEEPPVAGGIGRTLGRCHASSARAIIDVPCAIELTAGHPVVDPLSRHCHVACRIEARGKRTHTRSAERRQTLNIKRERAKRTKTS